MPGGGHGRPDWPGGDLMLGSLELIAVVSGAACVAGLVLAVVALVGTRRPPGRARAAGRG